MFNNHVAKSRNRSKSFGYAPLKDKYLRSFFATPVIAQHLQKIGLNKKNEQWVRISPSEIERSLAHSNSSPVLNIGENASTNNHQEKSLILPILAPRTNSSSTYDILGPKNNNETKSRQFDDAYNKYKNLHKLDNESLQNYESYLEKQLERIEDYRARTMPLAEMSAEKSHRMIVRTFSLPPAGPRNMAPRKKIPKNQQQKRNKSFAERWRTKYLPACDQQQDHRKVVQSEPAFSRTSGHSADHVKASHSVASGSSFGQPSVGNAKVKAHKNTFHMSAAFLKQNRLQQMCHCYIAYVRPLKTAMKAAHSVDAMSNFVNLTIMQQHCGGNTITVLRNPIVPNTKVAFVSFRQPGFLFSLVILEDDQVLLRLSVCCESKYRPGSRLGGKSSPIKWLGTKNALPCYQCHMNRQLDEQKKGTIQVMEPQNSQKHGEGGKARIRPLALPDVNGHLDEESDQHDRTNDEPVQHEIANGQSQLHSTESQSDDDSSIESAHDNYSHYSDVFEKASEASAAHKASHSRTSRSHSRNTTHSSHSAHQSSPTRNNDLASLKLEPEPTVIVSSARKILAHDPWICSACKFDNFYDEDTCRICGASK